MKVPSNGPHGRNDSLQSPSQKCEWSLWVGTVPRHGVVWLQGQAAERADMGWTVTGLGLCSGHTQWVAQQPGCWGSPTSSCPFTSCSLLPRSPAHVTSRNKTQLVPWETVSGETHRPLDRATVLGQPWCLYMARAASTTQIRTWQLCSAAFIFNATTQPVLQSGITVRSNTATRVATACPQEPAYHLCSVAERNVWRSSRSISFGLPLDDGNRPSESGVGSCVNRMRSLACHR